MPFPPRHLGRAALFATVVFAVAAPAQAAGSGGTSAPAAGTQAPSSPTGGATPGTVVRTPRGDRGRGRTRRRRPVLTRFDVSTSKLYDLGRPARVTFRIDGRAPSVTAKLHVLRRGERVNTIALGDRATGRTHTIQLTGREGAPLPEGALQLRLTARDPRGLALRASSRASATDSFAFYRHRFPVAGPFQYGGDDGRFGADRPGHVHQGQDLSAPAGTPLVAPRGGVVQKVAYQGGGAGHYVVLRASGENRTYVFMHLIESPPVRQGQRVYTGQRIGAVGSTGSSSGPHLHFEIWVGAWFDGGRAIDPLPDLRRWDAWS